MPYPLTAEITRQLPDLQATEEKIPRIPTSCLPLLPPLSAAPAFTECFGTLRRVADSLGQLTGRPKERGRQREQRHPEPTMTGATTRGRHLDRRLQQEDELVTLGPPIRLSPDPVSARTARQHVRAALIGAGRPQWADDAALAVSELVANVVLHARTDCEVSVRVSANAARVGVRDFSPMLPVERHPGPDATTGRGLPLVAALSTTLGVDAGGALGKVVWFLLSDSPPL